MIEYLILTSERNRMKVRSPGLDVVFDDTSERRMQVRSRGSDIIFDDTVASALVLKNEYAVIYYPDKIPQNHGLSASCNVAAYKMDGTQMWTVRRRSENGYHSHFQLFRPNYCAGKIEMYAMGGVYILDVFTGEAVYSHTEP
jgi:hypothetical protein